MATNLAAAVEFGFQTMEEAFPEVDCGRAPFASNYIVQVRRAITRTRGGIEIPHDVRRSEAANTAVAKVVGIGPACFKDPRTSAPWPEGPPFHVGDYIQVPKMGGFRFGVKWKDEEIDFIIFDHLQLLAKITGDPRKVTAFL